MYKIVEKQELVPNMHLIQVEAPAVAKKAQPGQFVIVTIDEKGERIPLTIADWDREGGSITMVFMEVGTSTQRLATFQAGDSIYSLVGPLGIPTHINTFGTVLCVGGCYGIAAMMPIARAMKEAGNTVISVIEARSRYLLFWEEELKEVSDQLITSIGDGSHAPERWIPDQVTKIIDSGGTIDLVVAFGCTYMMKLTAETTKPLGIKTIAHLSSVMVDGTGMCGCCRVSVGGETKFACVDGPEFDGHQVDWDVLLARQRSYQEEEIRSLQDWETRRWRRAR
ncbi:MAG: sulfide/dihydroorotate dehydrogenase-like FAD/NAD-binding protein [Deltaproteobacteria bacterium]|nr:sulfide/dihydroorotate dehydrogenase-like FAD/NAD-binding protein [Deltaproteobacteria bacterium]MBW2310833.1 sulfide/dihydroorotate dehydrogenase-like FAD/NAD-binding protein [Deltaproteobacteria bacterium]